MCVYTVYILYYPCFCAASPPSLRLRRDDERVWPQNTLPKRICRTRYFFRACKYYRRVNRCRHDRRFWAVKKSDYTHWPNITVFEWKKKFEKKKTKKHRRRISDSKSAGKSYSRIAEEPPQRGRISAHINLYTYMYIIKYIYNGDVLFASCFKREKKGGKNPRDV